MTIINTDKLDVNKLPELHREILENFLIPLNPDMDVSCMINSLNAKLAQMATFKRISFKEGGFSPEQRINYYALNFVPSGGGKDKIIREIDDLLLSGFKQYFDNKNNDYIRSKEAELKRQAELKFPDNEKKQTDFYLKNSGSIRNLRYEIKDGTPEGLIADCETLMDSELGSLFIRIPELGLFFKNPTQPQQLFINTAIELYEGKSSGKSTKNESRTTDVDGISSNCLFYSDTEGLLKDSANEYLMNIFEAGLMRRSFVTYQPLKELKILSYEEETEALEKAYRYAEEVLNIKLKSILTNIPANGVYKLTDKARKFFHEYKISNKKRFNNLLSDTDSILLKELQGRFWKCLKLAGMIAAINHPSMLEINETDITQAIYQAELFAVDLEQFFKAKPKSDTDKLFYYLVENKDKWISKKDIRGQNFVCKNNFKPWIEENIEYIKEMALERGFEVKEETFHNNLGIRYKLVNNNLGKDISPNVLNMNELLIA